MNPEKIYPRTNDHETVYLKSVVKNSNILVGDFTMYNDFVNDPRQFEKNNVLYHYPINHDKLIIGKFCSIACGAKFLFTSANHTQASLSTYPFPIFFEEWDWMSRTLRAHGTIKAILSSATIVYKNVWIDDMKLLSCLAAASASYRLPKNGTIHNCEFTRDYIRKGLTLPVRYEMYWNEQEQLWMGICTGFPPLPSVKELAQKLPPKLGKVRTVI